MSSFATALDLSHGESGESPFSHFQLRFFCHLSPNFFSFFLPLFYTNLPFSPTHPLTFFLEKGLLW